MHGVAGTSKGIPEHLPDKRIARVGLDQPGQVGEDLLDQTVMPDHLSVHVQRAGQIALPDILPGRKQQGIGAI